MPSQIIPMFPDSGTDAAKIQNFPVSVVDPVDGQTLVYNSVTKQWEPQTPSTVSLPISIANGGTGATSAPAANAAISGYTTTATAGDTTTLTNASSVSQRFTGTQGQTILLPSTATLSTGWWYLIHNDSTQALSVKTSTSVDLVSVPPGTSVNPVVVSTAGNTAAAWDYDFCAFDSATGTGAAVRATSPTIVTPSISGNFSGTGTANTLPNQLSGSGSAIMTRDLGDARYQGINLMTIRSSDAAARASTVTVADDDVFIFANMATGTYLVDGLLFFGGCTSGGMRWNFQSTGMDTSRSKLLMSYQRASQNSTVGELMYLAVWGDGTEYALAPAGSQYWMMIELKGLINFNSATNSLKLRYAQQVSNAGGIFSSKDSYMRFIKQ